MAHDSRMVLHAPVEDRTDIVTMPVIRESRTSEDCISRQAVLDELEKWDWQELYLPIHFKQILDDVPSVENKGEWIPIKDQLPKDGEEVLVSLTPNGVHGKKVDIDCFMMSDIKYWQSGKVEAWQPKPEPYKGKE